MNAFSNIFVARTFRKYFYIFAFCAIAFLCHAVGASPIIGRSCPEQCDCSANENERLTAKCGDGGDSLSWTGISYFNVSRLELLMRKQGGDRDKTITSCKVPRNLWRIFPRLSSFDASRCHLSRIPNNTFQYMTDLEEVDLSHNRLKTIDRSSFATNDKLKFVNLRDNPLHFDRNSPSLVVSSSIWELDLSECNVIALSKRLFVGLPNLKYLGLSSNKIANFGSNVLPNDLRTLNLAENRITNVPIGELLRLENLKEIDLSSNPINCTCELAGLQDSVSSDNRLLLVNSIKCAYPTRYAGKRLAFLSQYEICDESAADGDDDDENMIINVRRRSALETDGMIIDLWDDNYGDKSNEFIDFRGDSRLKRSATDTFDGSGDGSDEDGALSAEKSSSSEITSSQSSTSVSVKYDDTSSTSETMSSQSSADISPTSETISSQSSTNSAVDVTADTSPISETTSSQSSTTSAVDVTADTSPTSETISSQSSTFSAVDVIVDTSPISETTSSQSSTTSAVDVTADTSPTSETTSSQSSTNPIVNVDNAALSNQEMSSQPSTGIVVQNSTIPSTLAETVGETKQSDVAGTGQTDTTTTGQLLSLLLSSTTTAAVHHLSPEHEKITSPSDSEVPSSHYIIPTLLIVAIVIVCLSVYISQHSCRRKTGNQEAPKRGNNTTEMRLMMDGNNDPLKPNDCSAKYPNEENKEQTEKLISNGDTTIEIVAAAGTNENADSNGGGLFSSAADDNCIKDSKTSTRDFNENARRKFFQMLVKH